MRKILLFICVVAVTSVSAQEKKIIDFNKYLLNKQAEKIKNARTAPHLLPKIETNCWGVPVFKQQVWSKQFILPNGDRVVTNPAYNMPVVVTDIKRFRIMPNEGEDYFAKNFYVPGQPRFYDIPNGAAELRLSNKLRELLNKSKVK